MDGKSDQVTQGFNVSVKADKTKAIVEVTCDVGMDTFQLATILAELAVKILKQEVGLEPSK
jgi:hypothetical protein